MVDYDFYVNVYRGSALSYQEWDLFSRRAAEKLHHYQRIYTVTAFAPQGEGMAVCAMADAYAYFTAAQNGDSGAVSSASIGSVSVSYQSGYGSSQVVDLSSRGQERELLRCARMYLDIYRGVGRC